MGRLDSLHREGANWGKKYLQRRPFRNCTWQPDHVSAMSFCLTWNWREGEKPALDLHQNVFFFSSDYFYQEHVKDWLISAVVSIVSTRIKLLSILYYYSEKLVHNFYGSCVIFWRISLFMFIHMIIHILLCGVIHFQQIYLECMLLFAMSS